MSPYDVVENELFIQGIDIKREANISRNLYDKTYRDLGLHKPVFYFSIVPDYYPDHLDSLSDASLKDAIFSGLKQGYTWPDIEQALNLYTAWTKAESSCSFAKNAIFLDGTFAQDCHSSIAGDYGQALNRMEQNKVAFFLPSLRFHGLDNQYHFFLRQLFDGQSKRSKLDGKLVSSKIKQAAIWTIALVLPMLILCFMLSLILAYFQAKYVGSWFDNISTTLSYLFYVIPLFLLGTLSIVFLSTKDYGALTHWFPSVDILLVNERNPWGSVFKNFKFLMLPLMVMLFHYIAILSRQMKTALLEEKKKPYVTALLAKGIKQKSLFIKHLFPNSLITMITIFTSMIPASLAGSLVIEELFNLPGLGRLLFRSLDLGDINVSLPLVLILSTLTILSYLFADILNAWLNPKIVLSKKQPSFD